MKWDHLMRLLMTFCALFLTTGYASADVKGDLARIQGRLDACINADDSNIGMKQCTSSAYDAADKLLNQTYQRMSKDWIGNDSDSAERRNRLIAAQRAWIAFRDAECALQSTSMLGGSGEGLVAIGCLYKAAVDRAKQIEELMK